MDIDTSNIYHEKQKRYNCALHTLNNLFQRKEFSDEEIADFTKRLKTDHNVKTSVCYFGYYDVNFIEFALFQRGYTTKWLKNNKDEIMSVPYDKCKGIIINLLDTSWLSRIVGYIGYDRRHWISVVKIQSYFYNLDSELVEPMLIGGHKELTSFLEYVLNKANNFVILVYKETDKSFFESE